MTQVLRTTRALDRETVQLQAFAGIDGQGQTSYASAVSFEANVVEETKYITRADGSAVRVSLTLYIVGTATVVPDEQDRVVLTDGRQFIVEEKTVPRGLREARTAPDHTRLRCRREGVG